MITDEVREPMLQHAGVLAAAQAARQGLSETEAIQGVRQGSDALRKHGKDGTPEIWISLALSRAGGATPAQVEACAADIARLLR